MGPVLCAPQSGLNRARQSTFGIEVWHTCKGSQLRHIPAGFHRPRGPRVLFLFKELSPNRTQGLVKETHSRNMWELGSGWRYCNPGAIAFGIACSYSVPTIPRLGVRVPTIPRPL